MRERLQIVLRFIATCGLMISLVHCDGLFGDEETAEAECTLGETKPCNCFIEGVLDTAIQTCGPNGEFGGCDCDHLSDSSNQTGDTGGGEGGESSTGASISAVSACEDMWNAEVKPFIEAKCVFCHSNPPGPAPNPLASFDDLMATSPMFGVPEYVRVHTRVDSDTMPPGGGNTEEEKTLLAEWMALCDEELSRVEEADATSDEGGDEHGDESIAFLMNDITIQQLGAQDATGFIAQLLGSQWSFDIGEQNLNILFLIKNYNEATGEAVVQMAFGKGNTIDTLCIDPETLSDEYIVDAPNLLFFLDIDLVSIYSEDSEGVPFYCDSDPSVPNALPLRSIEGQMDVDADLQNVSGALNGCISEEEASTLCTCVGLCSGNAHPSCGGCPDGSAPLLERLVTISTTDDCTGKMGQPAFNLHLDLSGSRINPPALCD